MEKWTRGRQAECSEEGFPYCPRAKQHHTAMRSRGVLSPKARLSVHGREEGSQSQSVPSTGEGLKGLTAGQLEIASGFL